MYLDRSDATSTLTMCDVVGQPQRGSPTSSTEVVGQIIGQSDSVSPDGSHSNIVALCTLDGKVYSILDQYFFNYRIFSNEMED